MNDRRILVDFPDSDYTINGRLVSGPQVAHRVYRIKDGRVVVRFDRAEWEVYEDFYTIGEKTYSRLAATQVW